MKISIREAEEKDIKAVVASANALSDYLKEINPDKIGEKPPFTVQKFKRYGPWGENLISAIIAENEKKEVVGHILFCWLFSIQFGQPWIYMEDFFVQPEYRRKGIGMQLMRHLKQIAKKRKAYDILWSSDYGNDAAEYFYKKLGAYHYEENTKEIHWAIEVDETSLL